jgi:hypothetical protein
MNARSKIECSKQSLSMADPSKTEPSKPGPAEAMRLRDYPLMKPSLLVSPA